MTNDEAPEGKPTEEGKELELEDTPEAEVKTTEKSETKEKEEPQSDPLDEVEDIEELRGKAKGYRSAAQKAKKPPEPKEEEADEAPESGFLTKKDFYKANEKKAIHALTRVEDSDSDEVKADKAYITENWDQIRTFYSARKGKETTEDIQDDLGDAVMLFKSKNPPKEDDGSSELSETTGGGGGSKKAPAEEKAEEPPAYKLPIQPVDKDGNVQWYKDPHPKEKSE